MTIVKCYYSHWTVSSRLSHTLGDGEVERETDRSICRRASAPPQGRGVLSGGTCVPDRDLYQLRIAPRDPQQAADANHTARDCRTIRHISFRVLIRIIERNIAYLEKILKLFFLIKSSDIGSILILYHFTSVAMAESCMHSGISMGHLTWSDKSILRPIVWLTSSPNFRGHGLLTGQENITDKQMKYVERATGEERNNRITVDKTAIRIKIKIKETDRKLFKFKKFLKRRERDPNTYAKVFGLSAMYDIGSLSDTELHEKMNKSNTMEDTWWLYEGVLFPNVFQEVSYRLGNEYVSYDFEKQGRKNFRDQGLVAVSSSSLEKLRKIITPVHSFDQPKAFCICSDSSSKPVVKIRGGGIEVQLEIENPQIIKSENDDRYKSIVNWVSKHKEELNSCWDEAIKVLHVYNPGK